jgi:Domain of unknown function (DUF6265)
VSEEIWADPLGGVMMGMYRLVIDGKPSFYEFMHLSEEQGSLVLKLKHFNPDLTAWEEKDRFVTFPLVKLGTKEAFFSGLTFRLTPEGRLEILLALQQNGKVREEPFDLAIGAIHRREFVPRDPDCRISSVGACRDGRRWDQDYSRRERQGMSGERFPAVRSGRRMSACRASAPEAYFGTFALPFSILAAAVQSKSGPEGPPLLDRGPWTYFTSLCVTSWTSCFFFEPRLRPWI